MLYKNLKDGTHHDFKVRVNPLLWEKVLESDIPTALISKVKEARTVEIDILLASIDMKSVRSIRKKSRGTDVQADREYLDKLDLEADILRAERLVLNPE